MPQTSLEACILRAILSVQLCGTWQSGQLARTPERLEKWMVDLQLREHVVAHLVAAGAEFLGVGQFQRGVEAAPEDHAGDEAGEHQHAEPEHRARPAQHVPQFEREVHSRASDDAARRRPGRPSLIAVLRARRG